MNCSTTVAGFIAKEIERSGILDDYPNIDGIVALKQANGCVIDYRGVIFDTLKRTTWGYATNPNMGGVVMVGLGCEGFQIPRFKEAYGVQESETFRTMTIQEIGGTRKTVEAGVEAVKAMLPIVNNGQARDAAGLGTDAGAAMRRLGRLFRHHRQSGARRGGRHPGQEWRHGHPLRNARDLRRRTPAHPPREEPGSRREAHRDHPLVGGLHRPQQDGDEQQPLARQQARRADDDPREVARRGGEGRLDDA